VIEVITEEQAGKIIDTREPYGRFIITGDGFFTGIDNTTHDAWTEDFKDIKNCLAFLNGADLEDCLELEWEGSK